MSSILKALKRIEGQSPPPKSFPALPDSADAKQAVNSNAGRRWLRRRFITVGLVLLVIVGIAVIVYQRRHFLTSKIFPAGSPATEQKKNNAALEKSKIFRAKIPSTTVKQAPRRPAPPRPARQQTKSLTARQKTQKFKTNTNTSRSRAPAGQSTSQTRPAPSSKGLQNRAAGKTLTPQKSSRQKLTPSKNSIAGKRTASRKPAAAAPKNRETRTYAKLNDSKIKLQALAWSSDAARRMAVINGRIVREGESMDGYQINQIRQEDVVVSDGRQSWSLEFGLKQ
ncbi:MAG: general secretion pathway protein GspB [Deltaproteobacteria bacterium]|nr:general secretion pathway protein GspB [Deltaproteobacteria bacterium]